MTRKST